ncbi:MAG TPA: polyprenol monophosphomannose synthase [bacterium]|nr:polyprenol monophosphomannose synthase [bacterium]
MPRLTLLFPTYNECANIIPLIDATLALLPDAEIIVVDDSSPDGTGALVARRAATDPRIRLITRPYGAGLTSAFRDGIRAASGALIGWCDCDFSHPPDYFPAMLRALADPETDVVSASRYVSGARDARTDRLAVFASRLVNAIGRRLLTPEITDYTTGFLMARREVFAAIPLRGDYGEYCIDFLYRAWQAGFTVREIPYVSPPRRAGASKTATNIMGFVRRAPQYLRLMLFLRRES